MNKRIFLVLVAVFIVAFFLRILYLPKLALTFGYDQARDAFIAQEIVRGDLKILGPPASTPGLYHGVFYYYFLAPAYRIGSGNPVAAAYFVSFFNSLVVFLIYLLTYSLTKSIKASLISAVLFAVSYEATQYATWLSNPTLGVWTVPLIYLGLWWWISPSAKMNRSKKGKIDSSSRFQKYLAPALTAVGLGLSIQSEIFLAYHILPLTIWLWVMRKRVYKYQFFVFLPVLVITLSTMIAVEVKFGFKGIGGLLSLFGIGRQDSILSQKDIGDFVVLFFNQMGRTFSNSLLPLNVGFGGALGFVLVLYLYKDLHVGKDSIHLWKKFLLTYVFSHLPVVTFGGVSTPFLMVGVGVAMIILASVVVEDLEKSNRKLAAALFLLIMVSNMISILTRNKNGQVIFSIQKDLLLSNELQAIDYTYKESGDTRFSINTLTSPLWVNTVWSYLYNWYGNEKYGYVPFWVGRDQVGQLGDNLKRPDRNLKLLYFIKEPPQGIPGYYLDSESELEDGRSFLLERKNFGQLTVEKRNLK